MVNKFVYEIDSNKRYIFRFDSKQSFVSVTFPDETSSQSDRINTLDEFSDWVESVLGTQLPSDTLSLFQYVFNKEIKKQNNDFSISASWLVSNLMTNVERELFKTEAMRLDNEYFIKTGFRFDPGPVQVIYTARHRIDAFHLIHKFKEALEAS